MLLILGHCFTLGPQWPLFFVRRVAASNSWRLVARLCLKCSIWAQKHQQRLEREYINNIKEGICLCAPKFRYRRVCADSSEVAERAAATQSQFTAARWVCCAKCRLKRKTFGIYGEDTGLGFHVTPKSWVGGGEKWINSLIFGLCENNKNKKNYVQHF